MAGEGGQDLSRRDFGRFLDRRRSHWTLVVRMNLRFRSVSMPFLVMKPLMNLETKKLVSSYDFLMNLLTDFQTNFHQSRAKWYWKSGLTLLWHWQLSFSAQLVSERDNVGSISRLRWQLLSFVGISYAERGLCIWPVSSWRARVSWLGRHLRSRRASGGGVWRFSFWKIWWKSCKKMFWERWF